MIGGFADFQKWVAIFNLVNGDGPPPPLFIPPGGVFVPSVSVISGLISASGVSGKYQGNTTDTFGIITATMRIQVQSDNSGFICVAHIDLPIPAYFTDSSQAQIIGLPQIVPVSQIGLAGNIGSGWGNNLAARPSTNTITFSFETANVSTDYFIDFSFIYQIQFSGLFSKYKGFKKWRAEKKLIEEFNKREKKLIEEFNKREKI